jgi:FMN phosphatase YigB (HAD superfamily)
VKMRKIVFDLDDTLYKDEGLRRQREKAILDFLKEKKFYYLALRRRFSTIESLEKLGVSKYQFFSLMNKIPVNLKEDEKLIKILKQLREDYELVVLSNNSRFVIEQTLTKLGVLRLFDENYSGQDFGLVKPAEECFFMVRKKDVCVGNNFKKDLEVPKRIGATTVLVSRSSREKRADFNIRSVYALPELLKRLEFRI